MSVPDACRAMNLFSSPSGWATGCARALFGDTADAVPLGSVGVVLVLPAFILAAAGVPLS